MKLIRGTLTVLPSLRHPRKGYSQYGRESMTLAHANALLRVSKEGPPAGSKSAYKVSKKALDLWPSSQDERFTTKLWFPGLTEKPIRKIMDS